MSNLIPEKRLDKNGVLTTKHVRADTSKKTAPVLPRVSAPSKKKTKEDRALEKRISFMNSRVPVNFTTSKYEIKPSAPLEPIASDSYAFSCSSNDFYGLLEKLTLSDAIVLSELGIKADSLSKFIKKNKYDSYLVDNTELVASLKERGIDFRNYVSVAAEHGKVRGTDAATIDAAECCELYPNKSYDTRFGPRDVYSTYLLQETINLDDLKAIGVQRCADTEQMRSPLLKLKKGESKSTATEIGNMLDRTKKVDSSEEMREFEKVRRVGSRTQVAVKFGVEIAESSKSPELFMAAVDAAEQKFLNEDDSLSYARYVEATADGFDLIGSDLFMVPDLVYPAWQVGVPAEMTRDGLKQNLNMSQIIAIKSEGISPSVSSGWL